MPLTLSALNVYPVKGLKGIALTQGRCTERGLEHDRRWMVVDTEDNFISQRELPKMATIWTQIGKSALTLSAPDMDPLDIPLSPPPSAPKMRVTVWDAVCDALAVSGEADAWLSDYLSMECRLVYMPDKSRRLSNTKYAGEGKLVGFADGYAYLLAAEASLAELNTRLTARKQAEVPMNRFRPNLIVSGTEPYAEDAWKRIHIGQASFAAAKPCGRCQVPTTDQSTGEVTGPEPLATLATYRESKEFGVMFGMNLVTEKVGMVRVGDEVRVE
ncbi:MAG: MOSC N-terminal beta barrel domain-containing protein [Usitatibacter sp.]